MTTWNPLDLSGNFLLSQGGLRIDLVGTGACGVRSTDAKTGSGTTSYAQITVGALSAGQMRFGVSTLAETIYDLGSSANGWGYGSDGNIYHIGVSIGAAAAYTAGDVVGVVVTEGAATTTLQFYKNGTATGSAISIGGGSALALFAHVSWQNGAGGGTVQATAGFICPVPAGSGATAWGDVVSSYLAIARANAVTMLANSATWRAITDTVVGAGGKNRIIEATGGTPIENGDRTGKTCASDGTLFTPAPPFALVYLPNLARRLAGVGTFDFSGAITIELYLPGKQVGETVAQMWRRVDNVADTIADEITALFGTAGCLATGSCSTEVVAQPDDTGADRATIQRNLTLEWDA